MRCDYRKNNYEFREINILRSENCGKINGMPASFVSGHFLFISVFMRGLLLLLFTIGSISFLQAQHIEHEWTRFYSCGSGQTSFMTGISITDIDYVYTIHSFQEYSYTGQSQPFNFSDSNGDEDFLIIKTNKTGDNMWSKHIGGIGQDRPTGIEQLSNGDLIISGIFSDSVDFDPGQDTAWQVSQDQTDIFLLKLDKDGNYINCITFGGSGTSYLNDLEITENDEIFICGWYTDTLNFSPVPNQNIHVCEQGHSSYLSKFDASLNYISSIAFEGNIIISDMHRTSQETFLFTGHFEDTIHSIFNNTILEERSEGLKDVIYGEIDDQLNVILQKTIGSERNEIGWYIGQLSDGSIVLQMNFSEQIALEDGADSLVVEGIYPYIGTNPINAVFQNTMLLCLTGNNVVWHKRFSGFGGGKVFPQTEFVSDESGNLIASYYYFGQCNLGEENINIIYDGQQSGCFLLKIGQSGNIRWVRRMDAHGSGRALIYSLKLKDDNLYAAGQFNGSMDFDLSVADYVEYGTHDPFITKWQLNDQFISVDEHKNEQNVLLFPSPANNALFALSTNLQRPRIFDLSGREIQTEIQLIGKSYQISTEMLRNGAYILHYERENLFFTERFVVQH